MRFKRLRSKIDELRDITSSWSDGEDVSLLEMDMALERVKQIYELLRFEGSNEVEIEESKTVVSVEPEEVEPIAAEESEESIGIVIEEVIDQIVDNAAEQEQLIEEEDAENMVEQIVEEIVEDSSIALTTEEVARNKRERYNRICSLYEDDVDEAATEEQAETIVKPTVEPIVEMEVEVQVEIEVEEPISEQPIQVQTPPQATQSQPIQPQAQPINRPSMANGLTLNDRFLLSHDLFNDDMDALSEAIKELDQQMNYDDAIIYIAENYSWDGATDGAQIMIALLKRHFEL